MNPKKHANISIFVPFGGCPQQCSFCNQRSITGHMNPPPAEQVREEIDRALSGLDAGRFQAEIAFFGGSFTALDRTYMCSLLGAAQSFLFHPAVCGIRISTRPDAVDDEVLALLKKYGVTAIELGAQSMDDEVLRRNRRGHTAADVENAARRIRAARFELGLQMMTGLYGDTDAKTLETAGRLLALCPDTMRIYPTVVLEGTHLAALFRAGAYNPQTLDQAVPLCAALLEKCERHNVPVIRLGLHDSDEIRKNRLAGAYHPAFRELCESELFFDRMLHALEGTPSGGRIEIEVHPASLSKAIGQKKRNLTRFQERGFAVSIHASDEVEEKKFRTISR